MNLKRPEVPAIQVDMVPLIDIVTLVLMFLVIVGGAVTSAEGVKVNLPRADQAKELRVSLEGRITISLEKSGGVYNAVIGGNSYSIGTRGSANVSSLSAYLLKSADYMHTRGMCKVLNDGTYSIPVKLRIGEDVPMKTVEDVLDSLVQARLRDIHYAAKPNNAD